MTTTSRVKQAIYRGAVLAGLMLVPGCELERSDANARVTIDMRCGSTADCPSKFECTSDSEHGPPTTLCESSDPSAECPAGFDTKVVFGQTFCKPPTPLTGHSPRAGRVSAAGHRHTGGL